MDSICKFVPPSRTGESIQTVNFVYEAKHRELPRECHRSVYSVHLVTSGSARVLQAGREETVGPGDLYFLFPAVESSVEGDGKFRYLYISFFGVRAAFELERLGISPTSFFVHGVDGLEAFWRGALDLSETALALASESVLLYTLARIGARRQSGREDPSLPGTENAKLLKTYIDENFQDPDLSLDGLSQVFSYHKKYISALFKKHYRISVVEYIRTVRLSEACHLLENSDLPIKRVAESAGFRDALYFSRVFKASVGVSPGAYRARNLES